MGFAPLGCMPVTRRAPYSYKGSPDGSIGFIDAPVLGAEGVHVDEEGTEGLVGSSLRALRACFDVR
jgi:hypothetical protein